MLHNVRKYFDRFLREQAGNSVTEYAVMLSLIVLVAIGAITALGTKMVTVFTWEYTSLPDAG